MANVLYINTQITKSLHCKAHQTILNDKQLCENVKININELIYFGRRMSGSRFS